MIVIEPYRPSWPGRFADLGSELRSALGGAVRAIHHIGSTAVPGLVAKDVIDIQLIVDDLEAPLRAPLERLGYAFCNEVCGDHPPPGLELPPDALEKRYFRREEPRVNLHVRVAGRFNARYPLLCRDYLRATPPAAAAYGEIKRQLARQFPEDVEAYYHVKDPVFDLLMAGANRWAEMVGWVLPPSDA